MVIDGAGYPAGIDRWIYLTHLSLVHLDGHDYFKTILDMGGHDDLRVSWMFNSVSHDS